MFCVQPPTQQMAQMAVGGDGAGKQQERRGPTSEPRTRPEHITDKRGSSGAPITLRSNFVTLRNRPNCAIFQYNVSYSPPIESRGLRCGLLRDHESLIGNVRAFDGMILYLPHRLPDDVTEVVSTIQRDQTQVKLKITLTNEVAANSPVSLQLFNIIFRKYVANIYLCVCVCTCVHVCTCACMCTTAGPCGSLPVWFVDGASVYKYELALVIVDVQNLFILIFCAEFWLSLTSSR